MNLQVKYYQVEGENVNSRFKLFRQASGKFYPSFAEYVPSEYEHILYKPEKPFEINVSRLNFKEEDSVVNMGVYYIRTRFTIEFDIYGGIPNCTVYVDNKDEIKNEEFCMFVRMNDGRLWISSDTFFPEGVKFDPNSRKKKKISFESEAAAPTNNIGIVSNIANNGNNNNNNNIGNIANISNNIGNMVSDLDEARAFVGEVLNEAAKINELKPYENNNNFLVEGLLSRSCVGTSVVNFSLTEPKDKSSFVIFFSEKEQEMFHKKIIPNLRIDKNSFNIIFNISREKHLLMGIFDVAKKFNIKNSISLNITPKPTKLVMPIKILTEIYDISKGNLITKKWITTESACWSCLDFTLLTNGNLISNYFVFKEGDNANVKNDFSLIFKIDKSGEIVINTSINNKIPCALIIDHCKTSCKFAEGIPVTSDEKPIGKGGCVAAGLLSLVPKVKLLREIPAEIDESKAAAATSLKKKDANLLEENKLIPFIKGDLFGQNHNVFSKSPYLNISKDGRVTNMRNALMYIVEPKNISLRFGENVAILIGRFIIYLTYDLISVVNSSNMNDKNEDKNLKK